MTFSLRNSLIYLKVRISNVHFSRGLRGRIFFNTSYNFTVLRIWNPGSCAFWTPDSGSGVRKNPDPGSWMNISNLLFESFIPFQFLVNYT
jgi:hypothetical protein